jgi:glycosyltransferase involved in cell wall biosynthesis
VAEQAQVLYVHRWGRIMGGGEMWLTTLCESLDRDRFSPSVAIHYREALAERLIEYGIPVHILPVHHLQVRPIGQGILSPWRILGSGVALYRLAKQLRAQIIHTFCLEALQASLLAGRMARIPVVVSVLNSGPFMREDKIALRLVDTTIANAQSILDEIQADGVALADACVIRLGIDTERFATASGAAVRQQLQVGDEVPLVGMVGNIEWRKGYDLLIRAAAQVTEQYPQTRFLIVGADNSENGSETARLHALAAELGVAQHLVFMGARRDVPEILAALDVFVLCSRAEGLSQAMIEAMAAGKPVVVTPVGGTAEAVEQGKNGLLVPPNDPDALARGIRFLLANPGEARQMGLVGQQLAKSSYDVHACVRETEAVYSRLLAERRNGRRVAP